VYCPKTIELIAKDGKTTERIAKQDAIEIAATEFVPPNHSLPSSHTDQVLFVEVPQQ
jgi:hypothetical protein